MARSGVRELRGDPLRQGRGSPAGGAATVRDEDLWSGHLLAGSADAVPDLERLVAEHPLRERRWSLLVRALYRQGRQGAALEAWTRARDVLAVEFGVDPGPELRELQRQVLAQDPALDAPTRPLPAGLDVSTPLVGREVELSRLRHAWDRARAVPPWCSVALEGRDGSGSPPSWPPRWPPARRGWSATVTASCCVPTLVA